MELVLSSEDIDPLPEPKIVSLNNLPNGMLNSNYQRIVRRNFKNIDSRSVFSIKRRIKNSRFRSANGVETLVKVSVFLLITFVIFA